MDTPAIPPATKICTKCGIEKSLDEFSPANSRRHPHLRRGVCKECRALDAKGDRKDFPEKHQDVEQRRTAKDREKRNEAARKRHAIYYPLNREVICEKRRPQWRAAYAADPEKFRAKNRLYQKTHLHAWVRSQAKRRARKRGLPDTFSNKEQEFMYQYWDFACAVCGNQQGLLWCLAEDHWIPLASPLCPGTVATNMIPLCDGPGACNTTKRDTDAHIWLLRRFSPKQTAKIEKAIAAYFTVVAAKFGNAVPTLITEESHQ